VKNRQECILHNLIFRLAYYFFVAMFIALYLQGKFGPSKSSVVLALKSWWRPSFTFSVTGMHATCARLCTLEKDPYTPRSMNTASANGSL